MSARENGLLLLPFWMAVRWILTVLPAHGWKQDGISRKVQERGPKGFRPGFVGSVRNRETGKREKAGKQMMDYEEYMQSHPKVARSRAEKLINDRDCIFIQGTGTQPDLAVLPERGFASRPVVVDLQNLTWQCNV